MRVCVGGGEGICLLLCNAVPNVLSCFAITSRGASGSVGRAIGFAVSSLTADGVTVLCHLARYFIHCLVLVQPVNTLPDTTRLKNVDWDVMNQTKQTNNNLAEEERAGCPILIVFLL